MLEREGPAPEQEARQEPPEEAPQREVTLLDGGLGEVARLHRCLFRLGHLVRRTSRPADLATAPVVILPGGAPAPLLAEQLRSSGALAALKARGVAGLPTLAIGTALHALAGALPQAGERGVGLLAAQVLRLPDQSVRGALLPIPHLGLAEVEVLRPDPLLPAGAGPFYFCHSEVLHVGAAWDTLVVAQVQHGLIFPAMVRQGPLVGVQFHPQVSGAAGLALLDHFICGEGA